MERPQGFGQRHPQALCGDNPSRLPGLQWVDGAGAPGETRGSDVAGSVTDLGGWKVGTEVFLTAVLQTVAQPIWVVDPDGLIRFANPAAITALGYDRPDELFGRHSHRTIHHHRPDGTPYPASECPMLLPRTTGETVARDLDWFFRRDGSMFPVSYVSVPIEMPGGRGAVVAFTDIEERFRSQELLHERVATLADEQAALRRVATLVARGATPADVFAAVAREVAQALDLPLVEMSRYDAGVATVIGAAGDHPFQPGTVWPLDGESLVAVVARTGRPARIDDYHEVAGTVGDAARGSGVHAGVGAPILVDGELWGVIAAGGDRRVPLAPNAEHRLSQFTDLVATAISNTQARADLRRLADEQTALRRLATLIAQGADPGRVFDAVCEETGRMFAATSVNLAHFTPDGFSLTMAGWSVRDVHVPTGTRLPLEGDSINNLVRRTAAPGRFDSYDAAKGELAELLRRRGVRSEVGAPVVVEGRVWGALIAGTDEHHPLPPGTELRLSSFAELIATAVSNATTRGELLASRARIVEAADEQRRRVVRDLHDGAQQRLVHAVMTLQLAQSRANVPADLMPLLDEGIEHARSAIDELRELAHGIHPAILTHHGLGAAVEALAERAPQPVTVDIPDDRYPTPVESAAYFIAAEALTNVAKYAAAQQARVTASQVDGRLSLAIEDDGVGGAALSPGSGLSGLQDRVAALRGTLTTRARRAVARSSAPTSPSATLEFPPLPRPLAGRKLMTWR
jgi:PAS domain S-box-containing protein